jgi:biotin-(acetyl-CoA carboxylase) ligase
VRHGHAVGITDTGALVVRFADGHTEAINSGEISVRGLYGYV